MMKNQNLSVLVASSPALDSYHLSLAFAEQGITQLTQVSLEREQIIKQALINNHSVIALDVIGLSVEEAQSLVSNLVHRTGCKVIAIGDDEKIAYYRSLLSAGALEYLVNPIAPDALASLDFGHHHNGNQSGKRISVVGTKGGVGTSTVVANLARMMNSVASRQQWLTLILPQGIWTCTSMFKGIPLWLKCCSIQSALSQ